MGQRGLLLGGRYRWWFKRSRSTVGRARPDRLWGAVDQLSDQHASRLRHASGLSVVLESFPVKQLWMHRPWNYPGIKSLFRDGRFTTMGLSGRIREAVDAAHTLQKIADRKGIPVVEPFQGLQFGPLMVLSPTPRMYLELVPHFENTPQARYPSPLNAIRADQSGIGLMASALTRGLLSSPPPRPAGLGLAANLLVARDSGAGLSGLMMPPRQGIMGGAISLADLSRRSTRSNQESWTKETLAGDLITSEQNESSVVLYGRFNGISVLLTGDAGRQALSTAAGFALQRGIDLTACTYYQVPHHGSRHNVSPTVLDFILGPRTSIPVSPRRYAVASVAAGAKDYPRKSVSNAFLRRGVSVCKTAGSLVSISTGFPSRGYVSAAQMPFFDVVEDPDA